MIGVGDNYGRIRASQALHPRGSLARPSAAAPKGGTGTERAGTRVCEPGSRTRMHPAGETFEVPAAHAPRARAPPWAAEAEDDERRGGRRRRLPPPASAEHHTAPPEPLPSLKRINTTCVDSGRMCPRKGMGPPREGIALIGVGPSSETRGEALLSPFYGTLSRTWLDLNWGLVSNGFMEKTEH